MKNSFSDEKLQVNEIPKLKAIIEDLYSSNKKVIFTMGKGGVGKTTIAAAIALGLADKGAKVHLTTTDPATHLKFVLDESYGITISNIDEKKELKKYKEEVLSKAGETMSEEDLEYVKEDLRSPCTQEIAVFRAFAQIVEKSENEIVVIDTAPTVHTLLLLDSTESYNREIQRSQGDIPESVKKLLPKLRNEKETEVVIVTLAETTPVYEAKRLEEDLKRAGIKSKWWVINSSLLATNTTNDILKAKASNEIIWINKVNEISNGNFAVVQWRNEEIKGKKLLDLLK
ncbi:ArsA-related P-loop ATPase [Aminipila sp.]|uniref:ArsA-related P-loop ATPase n=1 Tax=Aminipila sp. TaxID=2060095 RepID=UPI002F3E671B